MNMKRITICMFVVFLLSMNVTAPTLAFLIEDDVRNEQSISWDYKQIEQYLQVFNKSLKDFTTIEQLKAFIGTPITAEDQSKLLSSYHLDVQDAKEMFLSYGDSLDTYISSEGLQIALDFYQLHGAKLLDLTEQFSILGITKEEIEKLFIHLSKLHEKTLVSKMELYSSQMNSIGSFQHSQEISDYDKTDLLQTWIHLLISLALEDRYYLDTEQGLKKLSMKELLKLEDLHGSDLIIKLHNYHGDFILDLRLSHELIAPATIKQIGSALVHLPVLSNNYPFIEPLEKPNSMLHTIVIMAFLMVLYVILLTIKIRIQLKAFLESADK